MEGKVWCCQFNTSTLLGMAIAMLNTVWVTTLQTSINGLYYQKHGYGKNVALLGAMSVYNPSQGYPRFLKSQKC